MIAERDNSSEMQKKFLQIASDCMAELRKISDAGAVLTPSNIGVVQAKVAKVIEQVHYGFHPLLED